MRAENEIQYDFSNIEGAVSELKKLQQRAVSCSSVELHMPNSKGDAKKALMGAYQGMTDVALSFAIMIEKAIEDIEYAGNTMQQEELKLSKKIGLKE